MRRGVVGLFAALGVVLYILANGAGPGPFDSQGGDSDVYKRILHEPPRGMRQLSDRQAQKILQVYGPGGYELVRRMLHKDPEQRPTIQEVCCCLIPCCGRRPTEQRNRVSDQPLLVSMLHVLRHSPNPGSRDAQDCEPDRARHK